MANQLAPPSDPIAAIPTKKADPLENTCTEPWLKFFNDLATTVLSSPYRIGQDNRSVQTDSIGPTDIAPAGGNIGLYSLQWWLEVTTVAAVASSLQVQISWTSNGAVKTFTGAVQSGNTLSSYISEALPIFYADAGSPITWEVAYTSNPANEMQYQIDVNLSAVNV